MRKIFIVVTGLLLCFLTACGHAASRPEVSSYLGAASENLPVPEGVLAVDEPEVPAQHTTVQQLPTVKLSNPEWYKLAEYLELQGLEYNRIENIQNDCAFIYASYKTEKPSEGQFEEPSHTYFMFDFNNSIASNVGTMEYDYYLGEPYFFGANGQWFFECIKTSGADNETVASVFVFDKLTPGPAKKMYSCEADIVHTEFARLNEQECIFLLYGMELGEKMVPSFIKVVKYRCATGEAQEIYQLTGKSAQGIEGYYESPLGICTEQNKIYMLLCAEDNRTKRYVIRAIDENGEVLEELEVESLLEKEQISGGTLLACDGELLFCFYDTPGRDSYTIIKKNGFGEECLQLTGQSSVRLLYDGLVQNRYLYFEAFADTESTRKILVFDTQNVTYWYVDIPELDAEDTCILHANEQGDVFAAIKRERNNRNVWIGRYSSGQIFQNAKAP